MNWIALHPFGLSMVVFYGIAFLLDLWLKFSGRRSISEEIWYLTERHPTLYSLGFILTLATNYMVLDEPILMCINSYISGHLYSGIASGVQDNVQAKQVVDAILKEPTP